MYNVPNSPYKGLRWRVETPDEVQLIEDARNYFLSMRLLINEGLGKDQTKGGAASTFTQIKRGKVSTSVKELELIKIYAKRRKDGELYDPKNFVRPEIEIPLENKK